MSYLPQKTNIAPFLNYFIFRKAYFQGLYVSFRADIISCCPSHDSSGHSSDMKDLDGLRDGKVPPFFSAFFFWEKTKNFGISGVIILDFSSKHILPNGGFTTVESNKSP